MTRPTLFAVILFVASLLYPAPGCQAESINTRILNRAAGLLETESQWDRADTRTCPQGEVKVSLYCALRQATAEEVGDSSLRTPAMEEVRAVIEERAGVKYDYSLTSYNNNPLTKLADIHTVLKTAARRMEKRLTKIAPRTFERTLLLEAIGDARTPLRGETGTGREMLSASVSIGDLNGDGHLDVVLGKGRHWPLVNLVLFNDGKGHFTAADLGTTPDRTYSAALADVNRDGHLDVVVSNDRPDQKLIYVNDGKGQFQLHGTFGSADWSTRYVTLADLNNDGYADLISANRGAPGPPRNLPQLSFICLNDGKGQFPLCTPLEGTESATIIVAADLDRDGAVDLFVPHRDAGQSLAFWNDGKGQFLQKSKVGAPQTSARAAAVADLDGDGRPDLVVGEEARGLMVYLNGGKRQIGESVMVMRRVPGAVAIVDVNKDGKLDIVIGNSQDRPGAVLFNDGTGINFREMPWGDGKGVDYGVAIGDLDGDGWPDIAVARSGAPNAVWFSGKANGRN